MRYGFGHERRIDQTPYGIVGRTGRQISFGDFIRLLERAAFEAVEEVALRHFDQATQLASGR